MQTRLTKLFRVIYSARQDGKWVGHLGCGHTVTSSSHLNPGTLLCCENCSRSAPSFAVEAPAGEPSRSSQEAETRIVGQEDRFVMTERHFRIGVQALTRIAEGAVNEAMCSKYARQTLRQMTSLRGSSRNTRKHFVPNRADVSGSTANPDACQIVSARSAA